MLMPVCRYEGVDWIGNGTAGPSLSQLILKSSTPRKRKRKGESCKEVVKEKVVRSSGDDRGDVFEVLIVGATAVAAVTSNVGCT